MKKIKLLALLAAGTLVMTGCNGGGNGGKDFPTSGEGDSKDWPTDLLKQFADWAELGFDVPKADGNDWYFNYGIDHDDEYDEDYAYFWIERSGTGQDDYATVCEKAGLTIDDEMADFGVVFADKGNEDNYIMFGDATDEDSGDDYFWIEVISVGDHGGSSSGSTGGSSTGSHTGGEGGSGSGEGLASFPKAEADKFATEFDLPFNIPAPDGGKEWGYSYGEEQDESGKYGCFYAWCEDNGTVGSNSIEDTYKSKCASAGFTIDDTDYETDGYYADKGGEEYIQFYTYEGYFQMWVFGPYYGGGSSTGTSSHSGSGSSTSWTSGSGSTSITTGPDGKITATLNLQSIGAGKTFTSQVVGEATFTAALGSNTSGNNPVTYESKDTGKVALRIYWGNTFTIHVNSGYSIESVSFTLSDGNGSSVTLKDSNVSVTGGSFSPASDGKSGTVSSVTGDVVLKLNAAKGNIPLGSVSVTYKA